MIKTNNKKICIVVSSLGKGGAERSSALLSQMFYDVGYDVHIVCILNKIEFPKNIDSSLLDTYIVQSREPLTTT